MRLSARSDSGAAAALVLCTAMLMLVACGSGKKSLTADQYYADLVGLVQNLDGSYAVSSSVAAGSTAPSGRDMTMTEAGLREFAGGLDAINAPSEAKSAHHDLTVASRNLADIVHRLGVLPVQPSQTPATDDSDSGRSAAILRDWESACHKLQDLALAKAIDVDLKCATVVHDSSTDASPDDASAYFRRVSGLIADLDRAFASAGRGAGAAATGEAVLPALKEIAGRLDTLPPPSAAAAAHAGLTEAVRAITDEVQRTVDQPGISGTDPTEEANVLPILVRFQQACTELKRLAAADPARIEIVCEDDGADGTATP